MGGCAKPPPGWRCIRDVDHPGPCAAEPLAKTEALSALRQAVWEARCVATLQEVEATIEDVLEEYESRR